MSELLSAEEEDEGEDEGEPGETGVGTLEIGFP